MSDIYTDVPVESDTTIIFENTMKFGSHDVLYQMWLFDEIQGESIILQTSAVSSMKDSELMEYICNSEIVKDKKSATLTRGDKYTFVNFNFKILD